MSALTPAAFLALLVCSWICVGADEDTQEVTVKPGQDVTLLCQAPRDRPITLLEWSKPDLKSDKYVFFCRENRPYQNYQIPSFEGRVQLRDPKMTDGDASVVLKNVNKEDAGRYECVVSVSSRGRRRRSTEVRHTISLTVSDSGDQQEHMGLLISLPVIAAMAMLSVGFVFWMRKRSLMRSSKTPAADEAPETASLSPSV